jgi:HEAT repeat protein
MQGEAKAAVPALLEALRSPSLLVRPAVIRALGEIGPDASAAVPALVEMLKTPDPTLRDMAATSLKLIDPVAAAKAGVP